MSKDTIYRQDAIEAIAETVVRGESLGYGLAGDIVYDLPSAQAESKWIPWWHKYPDNNRFVLVCNDDGRMAIAQYIGHEVDAYHPWQIAYCPYDVDVWDEDEHGKIVAWMDLPKPYKGDAP